ncbi:cyclic-phosphate processing receiver domain-containing protein [Vibrio sp. 10N.286.51.E5]|uniref:cyclic-phosphate processing receiver domain-containing protein n=1 Tax=Vibrio sp. 10N.286.51.E5 TaxID=3229709 RepID=UPI00354D8B82
MKVYLDGCRATPSGWTRTYTPKQTIELLKSHRVDELSLDYDLGDDENIGTGYIVLLWIEEHVLNYGYAPPSTISFHGSNLAARGKMLAVIEIIRILTKNGNDTKTAKLPKLKRLNEKLLCVSKLVVGLSQPLRTRYKAGKGLESGCSDFEFDYCITTYNRSRTIVSVTGVDGLTLPAWSPDYDLLVGNYDDTWRSYHRDFDTCYVLHSIEQHYDSNFFLGRQATEDDLLSISDICIYETIEHQFFEEIVMGNKEIDAAFERIISQVTKINVDENVCRILLRTNFEEQSDKSEQRNLFYNNVVVDGIAPKHVREQKHLVQDFIKYNMYRPKLTSNNYLLSVSFYEVREYHYSL